VTLVTTFSANDRAYAQDKLAQLLGRAAAGKFPPADGSVTVLPQPAERDAGVLAFTAHAVVFADADPGWIAAQLAPDDLAAPLSASFLHALGIRLGRGSHSVDMLTCAEPLDGPPDPALGLTELAAPALHAEAAHPRVTRALQYRDEVRVWHTDGGFVTLGRGLAGRIEVSVEVEPVNRGAGLGRRLATAARHLVPDGAVLWAQIAPGNAASVRAFLAAGYRPIAAEALLAPPASRAATAFG
jgi:GNAT superfamily N-acetyltransferase